VLNRTELDTIISPNSGIRAVSGRPAAFAQKPRDKCGVFAVYNYSGPGNAAIITYLGLLALQHRGQESAGMAYPGQKGLHCDKGMGLVDQVFTRSMLGEINAKTVLGHVRYSTTGSSSITNAQPLVARAVDGSGIALAHNGNLSNERQLRERLLNEGHIFHAGTDSEIILTYLFRYRKKGLLQAAVDTLKLIEGACAAIFTDGRQVVAFRDPLGFRPLVLGRIGDSYIFASETCALDTVGAEFVREVEPGEVVSIEEGKLTSRRTAPGNRRAFCIFEYVYFARPDSVFGGRCVHEVRRQIGALLSSRVTAALDLVIPSPDSGVSAAIGLAEAMNLPLEWAVHRNPYLGRTFIEPTQSGRIEAVRLKFNPIVELVRGKRVAVVDDSLVRGTTSRVLTKLLRSAGAAEVHLCIASPPYKHPCYYGIDIPVAADLAACGTGKESLISSVGADSITFAEPDDLYKAVGGNGLEHCTACFSGLYPTAGA